MSRNYRVSIKKFNPSIPSNYYWVRVKVYRPWLFWPFWTFNDTVLEPDEKTAFESAGRKADSVVRMQLQRKWERQQRSSQPRVKKPKVTFYIDEHGERQYES
jgi:hypothetical protein